jgi:hypothetical protein
MGNFAIQRIPAPYKRQKPPLQSATTVLILFCFNQAKCPWQASSKNPPKAHTSPLVQSRARAFRESLRR